MGSGAVDELAAEIMRKWAFCRAVVVEWSVFVLVSVEEKVIGIVGGHLATLSLNDASFSLIGGTGGGADESHGNGGPFHGGVHVAWLSACEAACTVDIRRGNDAVLAVVVLF